MQKGRKNLNLANVSTQSVWFLTLDIIRLTCTIANVTDKGRFIYRRQRRYYFCFKIFAPSVHLLRQEKVTLDLSEGVIVLKELF